MLGSGSAHLLERGVRVDPTTLISFISHIGLHAVSVSVSQKPPETQLLKDRMCAQMGTEHTLTLTLRTAQAQALCHPLGIFPGGMSPSPTPSDAGGAQRHGVPALFLGLWAVSGYPRAEPGDCVPLLNASFLSH